MFPKSCTLWNVRARPRPLMTCGLTPVTRGRRNGCAPFVGDTAPEIRLKSVVLPAPLGPITATISPAAREIEVQHGHQAAKILPQVSHVQRAMGLSSGIPNCRQGASDTACGLHGGLNQQAVLPGTPQLRSAARFLATTRRFAPQTPHPPRAAHRQPVRQKIMIATITMP